MPFNAARKALIHLKRLHPATQASGAFLIIENFLESFPALHIEQENVKVENAFLQQRIGTLKAEIETLKDRNDKLMAALADGV